MWRCLVFAIDISMLIITWLANEIKSTVRGSIVMLGYLYVEENTVAQHHTNFFVLLKGPLHVKAIVSCLRVTFYFCWLK